MTEEQLRAAYTLVWGQLSAKKKAHEDALAAGDRRQLTEIRAVKQALIALAAIKDVAKLATEESPEQVELLADPAVMRRGGY